MFKKILAAADGAAATLAMATSFAADMTGAGATFPYPIHAE
jgi:phosphate transport system substrate-binding protein